MSKIDLAEITAEDIKELLKERLTVNVHVYNLGLTLKIDVAVTLDGQPAHLESFSKELEA
jgi:hypothetical protein